MAPVFALTILTLLTTMGTIPPASSRTDAQVIAAFNERVRDYVEIHRMAAAAFSDPILCADPEELARQSVMLAAAIADARPGAREGDIFTAPVASAFRVRIAKAGGPVLRALPDLPPELEYRFADRDLMLVDVRANVVVDVLRNAVPVPRPVKDIGPPDACDVHPDLPACWM